MITVSVSSNLRPWAAYAAFKLFGIKATHFLKVEVKD